jgi:poly-gamma-glutamate capsule biosynthesis protein CapA/YwtB (metallophosphatase superfamily)
MIKIVGDVCFSDGYFDVGFGIGSELKANYDPFENLEFNDNNIWFGNLECVISDISNLPGFKTRHFRVPFKSVSSLRHLNVYSVANNHVMQHGIEAYNEMLANINKLGSKYVGSLSNKTITLDHQSHKFGFLVFSQRGEAFSEKPLYWLRPEYNEIETELHKIQNCDFKIVYMHWGNEFIDYPCVEQKKFAHWLIDIGFDLVIGTHPHVLQGYEVYKKKYIFYSLGNFLFNLPTEETRYSAIVNIDVEMRELKISYNYVFNDVNNKPKIITKDYVPKKYLFDTLNKKINFEADNEVYYNDMFQQLNIYRRKSHRWIIATMHKHSFKEFLFILKDFLSRRIMKVI